VTTATRIILITGTDTGVGKTLVTALLVARGASSMAYGLGVCKPVETGCEAGLKSAADACLLSELSGQELSETICASYCPPLAPLVAARLENRPIIGRTDLVDWLKERASTKELLLIEGSGGLLVPIASNWTYADLAEEIGAQVIVVVGSKLGALNHAGLTFETLVSRRISCLGYVCNDCFSPRGDVSLETNRSMLIEIGKRYGLRELSYLPYSEKASGRLSSQVVKQVLQENAQEIEKLWINCVSLDLKETRK